MANQKDSEYLAAFKELLSATAEQGASDLHLQCRQQPQYRIDGVLARAEEGGVVLRDEDVGGMIDSVLSSEQKKRYVQFCGVDFSYESGGFIFRVNVAKERGRPYLTARAIPQKIMEISDLGFPSDIWREIVSLQRGLVLVTGVTGSGKSTTLASFIQEINRNSSKNIITIEDPIEYIHEGIKSSIKQRELYRDVNTFAEGVEQAMRQDPNVISVGEIRDIKTALGVLNASDTGHLVTSTLHTKNSPNTITRYLDFFSEGDRDYVRGALADNLEFIVCQQLVPKVGGGRILAMEILKNNPAVKNLIRTGKTPQIYSAIQTGVGEGMITMDKSLEDLCRGGKISPETAVDYALDRKQMVIALSG